MDGELPGVEHRQIRQHILQCADCDREYEALLRMKRLLAQMRLREPQTDLASQILQRAHLAAQDQASRRSSRWLRYSGTPLRSIIAPTPQLALAASLLFAAGFALAHISNTDDPAQWRPASADSLSALGPAPINPLDPTRPGLDNAGIQPPSSLFRSRPDRLMDYPSVTATLIPAGDETVTVFPLHR